MTANIDQHVVSITPYAKLTPRHTDHEYVTEAQVFTTDNTEAQTIVITSSKTERTIEEHEHIAVSTVQECLMLMQTIAIELHKAATTSTNESDN